MFSFTGLKTAQHIKKGNIITFGYLFNEFGDIIGFRRRG